MMAARHLPTGERKKEDPTGDKPGYDFTRDSLTLRMRIVGIALVIGGVIDWQASFEQYNFEMSLIALGHEGETAPYICGMALAAALLALAVIVLLAPRRPSLGRPASVMSVAIAIACLAMTACFIRLGDAEVARVFVFYAIAGVLCRNVIRQGKVT